MNTAFTKTTVLDGYYATGDLECFCFDKHAGPDAHRAATAEARKRHGDLCDQELYDEAIALDPDECRIYPEVFLPEEAGRRRGRWTITVRFEPEE